MTHLLVIHQSADLYGSDRVLLALLRALVAQRAWQPIVVLPEDGPLAAALRTAGCEVHVAECVKIGRASFTPAGALRLPARGYAAVRALDRIVAGRAVALVHSNTIAVLAGAAWASARRVPHLWHVHEIIERPAAARRLLQLLVGHAADLIVANSTPTGDWIAAGRRRVRARTRVVQNGVPAAPAADPGAVRAFRERAGAGAGEVVATLVGRWNDWKGHDVALAALRRALDTDAASRLRLAFVGGPAPGASDRVAALRELSQRLGVAERTRWIDFVEDIWPVWHGTDIALVPSTRPEPFGLVAAEAMAAGRPVIASGAGGPLEIVESGHTGLLVPPGDAEALAQAMVQLAREPGLRDRMGEAGRIRWAARFGEARFIEQMMAAYREASGADGGTA